MVDHLDGRALSAPADERLHPLALAQPSLIGRLNLKASDARDKARNMPLGEERAEAMQQAVILKNAAEMLRHLGGRGN
ncbi:hypothetical protein [Bradyrhizobium betae]|uniref:Uncharacterized protein n=1 Tax=Bradyrhizobium betae TaxID=244734 RepID=A0A4Q1V525_9BRAD|nr:hypothetical protein [Bradyrhizobium betae]RXT46598.1 hypothetical protein B5V03_16855 [Bradyrhizobium betae]